LKREAIGHGNELNMNRWINKSISPVDSRLPLIFQFFVLICNVLGISILCWKHEFLVFYITAIYNNSEILLLLMLELW
jgi:hypothetical protein